MIQVCQDELFDDGREGVSKRNNRTKNFFVQDFVSVWLYIVEKEDGFRGDGTSKIPQGADHTQLAVKERSNQMLFYLIFF